MSDLDSALSALSARWEALESYQKGDVLELVELFTANDPRSLEEMIAGEPVNEYRVEQAKKFKDGYEVQFDNGLTGFFTTDKPIKKGDAIGLFTDGKPSFGSSRHGFTINGEVREYQTPFERFAQRIAMLASHDRGHRERAEQSRKDIAEWLGELHSPFRERIERFIAENPTFLVDSGTYETYVVLMAQRIHDFVRQQSDMASGTFAADWDAGVAIVKQTFEALPHQDQDAIVHGGKKDKYGISGFQFDSAKGLACTVLTGQEI